MVAETLLAQAGMLVNAGFALGLSQGALGHRLGVSRRTMSRWVHGTTLSAHHAAQLATLVHPADPTLAARVAALHGETLESLGLEKPPAPPPPPPAPPEPPAHMVDVVVCAAAEALDVSPRAVRGALLAAFRRAREAGLTIEQVERLLTPAPPPRPVNKRST